MRLKGLTAMGIAPTQTPRTPGPPRGACSRKGDSHNDRNQPDFKDKNDSFSEKGSGRRSRPARGVIVSSKAGVAGVAGVAGALRVVGIVAGIRGWTTFRRCFEKLSTGLSNHEHTRRIFCSPRK